MAKEGHTGAKVALRQIEDLSTSLSACQLGITLTSIGIGFLGEPVIAPLFELIFGDLSHGVSVVLSIIFAYLFVTAVHLTLGEQVPKVYAIARAENTLKRIAVTLWLFSTVFKPFIYLLNAVSNGLLRILGVRLESELDKKGTVDDLKAQITDSLTGGKIDAGEAGMLSGVFHLHEQEARQVMTPTPALVSTDIEESVRSALSSCTKSGHTRLLVTEDNDKDRVKGFVHVNALAQKLIDEGPDSSIASIVTQAPIVPESKPLDDLLSDLQRERTALAIVVDEYGRTAGLVTVEDIIEEVVGEIDDENDPTVRDIRQLPNGNWYVRGHTAVTDLADHGLNLPLDSDSYNSVGGLVFSELGRLPKRGDVVKVAGYTLRVESVSENRVGAVRIRPPLADRQSDET